MNTTSPKLWSVKSLRFLCALSSLATVDSNLATFFSNETSSLTFLLSFTPGHPLGGF
ncbi:MAG: hypothetical protein LBE49_08865 [Deltaproteobacteria bacterium]|nr:hypothetical protein [Deltaproteobacteria bacterium]